MADDPERLRTQLGETWDSIVHTQPNWSIVAADIEGEAMVKAMRVVDAKPSTGRP